MNMETEGRSQNAIAQEFHALGQAKRRLEPLDRQRVFCTNVDIALVGPNCVGCDCHTLQHTMGIAFQHAAIHKRAWITLIGITDHELSWPTRFGNGPPL